MNKNQKVGLRAILYSIVHALLIVLLYVCGLFFLAGMMFGIWLIFWTMVFDEYHQMKNKMKEGNERNEQ